MRADEIRAWDLKARAKYSYLADPPGEDTWRSHADDVLAGKDWSGDCDDLASTVLDLLGRAGEPLSNLYRVIVAANASAEPNHMIGAVADERGAVWVVGDTFGSEPYPAEDCPHRPVRYQRMSEVMPDNTWREGAPWAV